MVARLQPVRGTLLKIRRGLHCARFHFETVKPKHAQERHAQILAQFRLRGKGFDRLGIDYRRLRIHRTGFGQGKQPLDEIVHRFQSFVRPVLDLVEESPGVIRRAAAIKLDQSASHRFDCAMSSLIQVQRTIMRSMGSPAL